MKRREFIATLGSAAAWPPLRRPPTPRYVDAFRQGLNDTDYIEGQNIAIEYRWAEGRYDRLPAAAELVDRQTAVIATIGGMPAALVAQAATTNIPMVFLVADDPVSLGIVDKSRALPATPQGSVS